MYSNQIGKNCEADHVLWVRNVHVDSNLC